MIQRRIFVTGRVQGVGFRASVAREAAREPGLRGFVRNLPDGRVEAVFSGSEAMVTRMVEWCRQGPPAARVEEIEIIEEAPDFGLGPFGAR